MHTKQRAELYDLSDDHAESKNIATQHPAITRKLLTLLLGERVDEPKGFANTYHQFIGSEGANTSDPGNWSDYVYANAGITYMSDNGGPKPSWVAKIENTQSTDRSAIVDQDRYSDFDDKFGASRKDAT